MSRARPTPIETWGLRVPAADLLPARRANARLARARSKLREAQALAGDAAAAALAAAADAVALARIAALCPYCAGAPRLRRACTECRGTAFVGAAALVTLAPELRARGAAKLVFARGKLVPLSNVKRPRSLVPIERSK